jgi:hypothetical protein
MHPRVVSRFRVAIVGVGLAVVVVVAALVIAAFARGEGTSTVGSASPAAPTIQAVPTVDALHSPVAQMSDVVETESGELADLPRIGVDILKPPTIGPAGQPTRLVTTAEGDHLWGYDDAGSFIPLAYA